MGVAARNAPVLEATYLQDTKTLEADLTNDSRDAA